jgi:tripartite-type tricarboxylate transporter receptor subunit TctC
MRIIPQGLFVWLMTAVFGFSTAAWAEDFYKGKTIRFIVGQAPCGGYDLCVHDRATIGKHIPGHPGTHVQNMEGAGSLISANYVHKQASRDGLTVIFNNSLVVQKALGDPRISIDFRKLGWVGARRASACRCAWLWDLPD